ncbi:M-phase phosphoprotein 6 isoform X2 [Anabrus simplex]
MKKSKEKAEKEQEAEDSRAIFSDAITEGMKHGGNRFIIESSYIPCEDLIVGRLSFQGMNPEIERIMQLESEAELAKVQPKTETEISDEEMAHRYNTLVSTIGQKFNTKRENRKFKGDSENESRKKRAKFLKPSD